MSDTNDTPAEKGPINEGAVVAGGDNTIFNLTEMEGMLTGKKYSSAIGPVVEGERTQVGLMKKAKGTGAHLHSHPNEQWNYVVQGKLRVTIGDQTEIVGPGTLLYFPPNVQTQPSRSPKRMSIFSW